MPRRLTLPHAASSHPDREWPTSEFWITRFENDVGRLTLSRLWQIGPLKDTFWQEVPDHARRTFVAWEVRHTQDSEVIALFWRPDWERCQQHTLVTADEGWPLARLRWYDDLICFTADRAWGLKGPAKLKTALSLLVHALDDTDPDGREDRDFYGRHYFAWGPMSDEDAAALEGLGT